PAVALKLLKGAVTVHESSHRPIVPCQISNTVSVPSLESSSFFGQASFTSSADVLGRCGATHAREVAPYRSWLAVALADANEPEQAAEEAKNVIAASGDLSSERTEDVPEVREVLADYGRLLLV
ncbi:hypothetical protein ACWC4E_34070, partial [Streptomyces sp. NPDC001273]